MITILRVPWDGANNAAVLQRSPILAEDVMIIIRSMPDILHVRATATAREIIFRILKRLGLRYKCGYDLRLLRTSALLEANSVDKNPFCNHLNVEILIKLEGESFLETRNISSWNKLDFYPRDIPSQRRVERDPP